jgi:hypothetical protein
MDRLKQRQYMLQYTNETIEKSPNLHPRESSNKMLLVNNKTTEK